MCSTQLRLMFVTVALMASSWSWAYDSESSGIDGVFSPTVNTQLQSPPDGVFNFAAVTIPAGVTVTFKRNAANTPIMLRVGGDVTIAGTLDVSGTASSATGTTGDGALGDDGLPGLGGPGGYDGGRGGSPAQFGGAGLGAGAGAGKSCNTFGMSAAFGDALSTTITNCGGGSPYGNVALTPLVGGSGGGGGKGGTANYGSGGGGGGGAILIAASGTVNLTGAILANAGASGTALNSAAGGYRGGGGSGGAIKIIASSILGNGALSATGGGGGFGNGSVGRIRLEAETFRYAGSNNPSYRFAPPAANGIPATPSLRIVSIAGQAIPNPPTGGLDLALPATSINPVDVQFQATGIPLGTPVKLVVTPASGDVLIANSGGLTGTQALSSAVASVTLPQGPSVLLAQITFTVTLAMSEKLAPLAGGDPVREMRLTANADGNTKVILVSQSGREIPVSAVDLATALNG